MSKVSKKQIIINRFDGGIADDIRQQSANSFAITKHFDIFSNPNRLTPYRSTRSDMNDGSTSTGMKQYDVRNFQLGSDSKVYGLGIQPGAVTRTKVVCKVDPTSGNWTLPATAEGSLNSSNLWRNCFIEWQGAFWMFGGTNAVSKWVIGGTFTDTVASLGASITYVTQGVIAADNNLYIFYNNKVVRVSPAGVVTDNVLTIPSDMRITSACRVGDSIAIGAAKGLSDVSGFGRSQVFIWDTVSSDISAAIDWGAGQLMCLANLEGLLVGISDDSMSSALGINNGSMVIRSYNGGYASVIKEIKTTQAVTLGQFLREVVVKDNKMYWVANVPFNTSTASTSTFNLGIYSYGRKNVNSPFTLTLDTIDENINPSMYSIQSFGNAGHYWFINHSQDGSIYSTDNSPNYTFTSVYETVKFNGGDSTLKKVLIGTGVSFAPLPSGATVTVKYKADSDTSFTTFATKGSTNAMVKEAVNVEPLEKKLPEFYEIQLRIESTGGAEITGYKLIFTEAPQNLLSQK